ncbi:MAG: hypothetical protein WCR31_01065 [Treponema sp.]
MKKEFDVIALGELLIDFTMMLNEDDIDADLFRNATRKGALRVMPERSEIESFPGSSSVSFQRFL